MQLDERSQKKFEAQMRYAEVQGEFQFGDAISLVWKKRKPIAMYSVGAGILATLVALILPKQYTAETVIMPPGQNSPATALLSQFGAAGGLMAAAGASLGMKTSGDMYVSLLRSRTVEDAVVQRFGLMTRYHAKKPSGGRGALEAHSKVTYGTKDGLITIKVTDFDPKEAAAIANGYVDAYQLLSAHLAITEASHRRVFFEQQLLDAKEKLASAEEALKAMEQATGVLQIDSQTRALLESAVSIRAQIAAKEVQLQGLRSFATEENPQIYQAQQELAGLQAQLAKLGGTDQASGLIVPKGRVSEEGLEYIRKVRDVKYYDTVSELLAMQLEMAKLDEARQGTAMQVVDSAVPPDTHSFPKRTIIVLVAALLGLFGSSGWYIAKEMIRRRAAIHALSAA
jgi:tyrosine-protein kinase Etk/Wzc